MKTEIKDIRDIDSLMMWITENIHMSERLTGDKGIRAEAEWFLACNEAASWLDNRRKDNAYFVLNGITPLKGNNEQARRMLMINWDDSDYDSVNLPCAIESMEMQLANHFNIEFVDNQIQRFPDN